MAVSSGQDDDVMASINITPLTDVLLVLLIIFMIAAAAIQKERIKIPLTHYKAKANETDLIISIQKDKSVFVGALPVKSFELESYLEKIVEELPIDESGKPSDKVIIKADEEVPYGSVAEAMDAARAAGLNDISLATKPLQENPPENNEEKPTEKSENAAPHP